MKLTQMTSGMMIMSNIPVHLLNSKLITNSEWEEYQSLKERFNLCEKKTLHPNHRKRGNWYTQKAVEQYSMDGYIIKTYPSASEAGRETGFAKGHIIDCCNGKQKSAYGYIWRYVDSGPYIPPEDIIEAQQEEIDRLNNIIIKLRGNM